MAADPFITRIAEEVSKRGEVRARSNIRSSQLRQGLRRRGGGKSYNLYVPHYWAVYNHDGRRAVSPTSATILVWFKDKRKDPRLFNGRSPERLSQARRLTKGEFYKGLNENRRRIAEYKKRTGKKLLSNGEIQSLNLPMIISRKAGPAKGDPFFSNGPGGGMSGFSKEVGDLAASETSRYVKETLSRAGLLKGKRKTTIRF